MRPGRLRQTFLAPIVVAVLLVPSFVVAGVPGPIPSPRTLEVSALIPDLLSGTNRLTPAAGTPTWVNITGESALRPPPRVSAGMVYDSTDGYLLMFGGEELIGVKEKYYNDTWKFSGGVWTNITTPVAPSARFGFELADDPADHAVVLFGGYSPSQSYHNDTWEFKAGVWTNVTHGVAPPGTFWGSMSYDTALSKVVLFGGNTGLDPHTTEYTNETWTFSAGTWTELTPAISPPGRDDQVQVDDPATGQVIMFGGLNDTNYLNDTWAFAGDTWALLPQTTAPDLRGGAGMAYDAAANAVVMYGGYPASEYYYSTWVLTGGLWTSYSLSPTPPAGTIWGQMAYDAADHVVLQFQGNGAYNATWELSFAPSPALSVAASATPLSGTAPLEVTFLANASGGTPPFTYAWKFGDGISSILGNTTHTYAAGSYTANLTVQDHVGDTVYRDFAIDVTQPVPPPGLTVTVSASPTTVGVNQTVSFTSAPLGGVPPYTFAWTFGDGGTAETQNATHEYAHVGTYTAGVRVQDSVGNVAKQNVTITVQTSSSSPSSSSSSLNNDLWIVAAIVVAALAILLVVFFRRRRKSGPTPAAPAAGPVAPPPPPPAPPGGPPST